MKTFQEIFKQTSSIESLLNENEKKWYIPYENLEFGKIIGRGAFGVVVQANLKQTKYNNTELLSITNESPKTSSKTLTSISSGDSGLESSAYYSSSNKTAVSSEYQDLNPTSYSVNKNLSNSSLMFNVAIKKLSDNVSEKSHYELYKELKLMLEVGNHSNIINLVGYSVDSHTSFFIVTDYAKFGNLKDFLRNYHEQSLSNSNTSLDKTEEKITPDHLLLYAYQIASGMEYLHSKKVHLIGSKFLSSILRLIKLNFPFFLRFCIETWPLVIF
jgi:serine/threonine protein kinase